jgi:hypothetical protein
VLRYAPHNLLLRSEEFNESAWVKLGGAVTGASINAIVAPDGTTTADKFTEDSSTGGHNVGEAATTTAAAHTFSVYAKAAERTFILLYQNQGFIGQTFNLATGELGGTGGQVAPTSASITAVGNGWYRCSITTTTPAASTSHRVYLMPSDAGSVVYTGDGTSGVYLWGAQLNLGSFALTYIPTTTAAVYSLPRDHNPTTLAALGVLVEEARTNLLTYSEQFDNAAWTKFRSSVTANAATSPDGTTTSDKHTPNNTSPLTSATGSGTPIVTSSLLTNATTYSLSVYAKADGFNRVGLFITDAVQNGEVLFGLSGAGSVVSATGATGAIVALANGWYRCTLTKTALADVTILPANNVRIFSADSVATTGNGTSGIYVWGAQLEAGAFATSLIPTVASQVTRAADQISILTSAFPWNNSTGTFSVEANVLQKSSGASGYFAACAGLGGNDNTHNLYRATTNEELEIRSGASAVAIIQPAGATGSVKMAYAYAVNDYAISKNGGAVGSDTLGALPVGVDRLQIGTVAGGNYANGHIKRLNYYAVRKTNAELVVLST